VIQATIAASIPVALAIWMTYHQGMFFLAFALTLVLATQSAFYSPAKYGIIREMYGEEHLTAANAAVQAVTIVAILLGSVAFSVLFEAWIGTATQASHILTAISPAGIILVAGAVLQTFLATRLPATSNPGATQTPPLAQVLRGIRARPALWGSMAGLALFWAVNQVLFAAFGAHLKEAAGVTSTVVAQGLLAIGGAGIVAGSALTARVCRRRLELGLVALGALGMAVCMGVLPWLTVVPLLGAVLILYGACAGLFIVPLNSLIQLRAPAPELGIVLAAANFLQNAAMLGFLVLTIGAAALHMPPKPMLLMLAVILAVMAAASLAALRFETARLFLRALLGLFYRVRCEGIEHLPATGPVLVAANHVSWIDWAVLLAVLPRPVRFVIYSAYAEHPLLRPILRAFGVIPVDSRRAAGAIRSMRMTLLGGGAVAIFPEGGIARTPELAPFQRGLELACRGTQTAIVPVALMGLWGSLWSRCRPWRWQWRRTITVRLGAPLPAATSAHHVREAVAALRSED
jgi:acyl-[acyl-carrier-protein]-phospholipid O-acyltransferase/long-chain-fatty-acid--[acyl-carrier-protein] ligase